MDKIIASFFGLGYAPKAPGTVGALGACFLFAGLKLLPYGNLLFYLTTALILIGGTIAAQSVEKSWGKDDNKVVIDEALGMGISLINLPLTFLYFAIAFVLFRIFDIWKPLMIRRLEKLKGGLGVMADDFLAGVYVNVIMQILLFTELLPSK